MGILDSAVRGKLDQEFDGKRCWNRQTAVVQLEVVLQEEGSKEDRSLLVLLSHLQMKVIQQHQQSGCETLSPSRSDI